MSLSCHAGFATAYECLLEINSFMTGLQDNQDLQADLDMLQE
jgi:hypothetical protein